MSDRTFTQAEIRTEIARLVQEQMRQHEAYANRLAYLARKQTDDFNTEHDPVVVKTSKSAQSIATMIAGLSLGLMVAKPAVVEPKRAVDRRAMG